MSASPGASTAAPACGTTLRRGIHPISDITRDGAAERTGAGRKPPKGTPATLDCQTEETRKPTMTTRKPSLPADVRSDFHAGPQRPQPEAVPDPQGSVARQLFRVLAGEVDPAALSFGDGTVLAARWEHRTSFDVDLFCRPETYEALDAAAHARIERAVGNIPGCDRERMWCEPLALYAEINGIQATVLPRSTGPTHGRRSELTGTRLRLQNTEEILYGKIFQRLYGTETITVRDVYDVASAARHDQPALQRVLAHLGGQVTGDIGARLASLPRGWSGRDPQPVINPAYDWNEAALVRAAQAAMQPGPPVRGGPER